MFHWPTNGIPDQAETVERGILGYQQEFRMDVQHREFSIVDAAARRRPDAASVRVTYSSDRIEVFKRYDLDVDDMLATFGIGSRSGAAPRSGSAPLVRFVLVDGETRSFSVEAFRDGNWETLAERARITELGAYVRDA